MFSEGISQGRAVCTTLFNPKLKILNGIDICVTDVTLLSDHHSTALRQSCLHRTPPQAAITSQGRTCLTSGQIAHTMFHPSAHGSSTLKTVPSLREPKEIPSISSQRTNGWTLCATGTNQPVQ